MTVEEIQQRCKDEWEMQVEIFRSCYAKGYNDAKRDIALSGEYERAYQRGYADGRKSEWTAMAESEVQDADSD